MNIAVVEYACGHASPCERQSNQALSSTENSSRNSRSRPSCSDETVNENRTIILVKSADNILLWDVDDCVYLRTQLRLLGDAVGSLPTQIHQNVILGVPMLISPECAFMLVNQGKAKLVDGSDVLGYTEAHADRFLNCRSEDFKSFDAKHEDIEKHGGHFGKEVKNEVKMSKYPDAKFETNTLSVAVTHDPKRTAELPPMVNWDFPRTAVDWARLRIFRDLYERGFYMTSGCKFGGDYLCYRGDPAVCHSTFIVRIVAWDYELTALELVGLGRLGVAVKKTSLLAAVNESTDEIRYISLSRSPFDTPRNDPT
ncbi:hypothetical protein SARC_08972 [Sphaeroforma arctica JP610]|uniref:tRNA-intron lyase n=1 Tax=Sphaeroforma arctica JP610 TaxID=667725 RepID=A0A0L0FP91_9EUKA|nr:hypothetical protein SARC_08972 [Sphaeroforma arctica JP610]KNC78602.1 hypothetical protein SARC_08972 [Sphaeroforma arctica JP610]|eukprot:XP_014152504.1 hypothetical protein SARC_08972 [Sphaeroforma arctica JP610]